MDSSITPWMIWVDWHKQIVDHIVSQLRRAYSRCYSICSSIVLNIPQDLCTLFVFEPVDLPTYFNISSGAQEKQSNRQRSKTDKLVLLLQQWLIMNRYDENKWITTPCFHSLTSNVKFVPGNKHFFLIFFFSNFLKQDIKIILRCVYARVMRIS